MTRRGLPAAVFAALSALLLVLIIFLGSRGFKDFDSALIGYAVATVLALAAIVYRYTPWITRPPTWRYFKSGWRNFRFAKRIPKLDTKLASSEMILVANPK